MSDESRRVLEMLAQGKISVEEADQLLQALGAQQAADAAASTADADQADRPKPRFIRINVHKPANERRGVEDLNIRVPVAIVKGGMRLGALIPGFVGEKVAARLRERGIDLNLNRLDPDAIASVLRDMGELSIDVDGGKQQVRITCE